MTVELIEAAMNALSAHLQDNMAAKLVALEVEYADFELDDIRAWYLGEIPIELPEYPSIVIRASSMLPDIVRNSNVDAVSAFDVICLVGDVDVEQRFRKLARYARAVFELLHDGVTGYIVVCSGEWRFSEVMPSSPFLQGLSMPVTLNKVEAF